MAEEEGQVIACHTLEDWNEKIKSANESNKLIVIDFTASWCPPCRLIAPVFVDMAKKFTNVVFFKIDVDELQVVAKEFKVEAMPTFVYMKEGEIVDRIVGADKDEIQKKLMKHGEEISFSTKKKNGEERSSSSCCFCFS